MSDEEYEKFEVTDYDLTTEFNPNRFRRKQTKHQAVYGIWADDDISDGGDDSHGKGRGKGKDKANYASGVAFISAGLQQPITKEDEGDGEIVNDIPVTDSSSEDEATLIPKAFGKKMEMDLAETAGLRSRISQHGSKSMGMYGIGAKLALKMGYQPGKGLGKDLQGISAPIEAVQRKGRGAIGAYGRETKSKPADITILEDVPASSPKPSQELTWRKDGLRKNKPEVKYVTMDEVLEQKSIYVRPDAGFLAKTKVIDLTGPETRVLSGYHAISGQKKPKEEWDPEENAKLFQVQKSSFEMPELTHNINLILDNCEQDIMKNDRKSKYAVDREATIHQELIRLHNRLQEESNEIESTHALIELVNRVNVPGIGNKEVLEIFDTMQRHHREEWQMFELYNMASNIAVPILTCRLKSWNPLTTPSDYLNVFSSWKGLLSPWNDGPFHTIMWEGWMPSFRRCLDTWNVKDSHSMLLLLETWRTIIPSWIYTNILDLMILPKINDGVDAWDPLSDNIPIHAWIHPWISVLGVKLDMVYPTIRRKLASALVHWHPSDASGKQILTPWINVFSKGSMDAFIVKNIVPKLQLALQELILSTQTVVPEPWNWVMDWCDVTPANSLVQIFESAFFPKWLQFLVAWLNQRPVFEEIYRWYTWWRTLFPEILMRDPVVTESLQKALEMINAAIQAPGVQLDFQNILNKPSPPPVQSHAPTSVTVTPELMADAIRMTSQVPNGFRDLVQLKCEQLGLLFMPIPNKFYEGKQVYRCGDVAIYITANVIFLFREGTWVPTSLQQLLHVAGGS